MKPSAVTTAEYDLDPVFDPPEAMIDRILHDIASPEGSLRNLALAFSTTAPALAAWLAWPDIAARLEALHAAAAMRVRLVAATALPRVVSVALAIINQFHSDESHVITRTSSVREAEYHRRGAETARRAASLIARLANYRVAQPSRLCSSSPSPREGAGGRAKGLNPSPEPQHTSVPHSPSQREGAGGWASPRSDSPSLREGAGGRAKGPQGTPEPHHTSVPPVSRPCTLCPRAESSTIAHATQTCTPDLATQSPCVPDTG